MMLIFFFNPTDRPTQYQETHSTPNEKKKGEWTNSILKGLNSFLATCVTMGVITPMGFKRDTK